MRLLFASVFFLVLGAACLALAVLSLIGRHHHSHVPRIIILVGGGIGLMVTGERLLAQAIAQKKNSCSWAR
jgi:hypothetical protein